MKPPDAPPRRSSTRRRVRVFVIASIVVVLVVGFWPVMGYRITDGDRFIRALDLSDRMRCAPSHGVSFEKGVIFPMAAGNSPRQPGDVRAVADFYCFTIFRRAAGFAEFMIDDRDSEIRHLERSGVHASIVAQSQSSDVFVTHTKFTIICFHFRNIACHIGVEHPSPAYPDDESAERLVLECLDSVVAGLRNEVAGVTRVYMPPFLMLWREHWPPLKRRRVPLGIESTF